MGVAELVEKGALVGVFVAAAVVSVLLLLLLLLLVVVFVLSEATVSSCRFVLGLVDVKASTGPESVKEAEAVDDCPLVGSIVLCGYVDDCNPNDCVVVFSIRRLPFLTFSSFCW